MRLLPALTVRERQGCLFMPVLTLVYAACPSKGEPSVRMLPRLLPPWCCLHARLLR